METFLSPPIVIIITGDPMLHARTNPFGTAGRHTVTLHSRSLAVGGRESENAPCRISIAQQCRLSPPPHIKPGINLESHRQAKTLIKLVGL